MIKRYEHTQVGYLIIVAMAATMVLIGIILANTGINWIAIGVLIVIAIALVLFPSLTVIIWEEEMEVKFGPGLVKKRYKLSEIQSCKVAKYPWYYGWSIRLIPHGILFRVSGFHAVDLQLVTGKSFSIGEIGTYFVFLDWTGKCYRSVVLTIIPFTSMMGSIFFYLFLFLGFYRQPVTFQALWIPTSRCRPGMCTQWCVTSQTA